MAARAQNSKSAAKRVRGRPFKPGQSGNPGGRPKGVAAKARELIGDDPGKLLKVLLNVAQNTRAKPAERIAAANAYLDRAYGKAPAFAPIEDADPLDREILDEVRELVDELAEARARRADPTPAEESAAAGAGQAEVAEHGKAGAASAAG